MIFEESNSMIEKTVFKSLEKILQFLNKFFNSKRVKEGRDYIPEIILYSTYAGWCNSETKSQVCLFEKKNFLE